MKKLLLLRHGKSDWNTHASDFERPLKKRGVRQANRMGKWLVEQKMQPDLLISSPAKRAISTAENVCQSIALSKHSIKMDKRVYEAESDDLLQVISEVSNAIQCLLIIGHNPGMEELLERLIPNIPWPDDAKLLPTSTLACLQFEASWETLKASHCMVSYMIQRSKDLS